jgi:hypothetical protein
MVGRSSLFSYKGRIRSATKTLSHKGSNIILLMPFNSSPQK